MKIRGALSWHTIIGILLCWLAVAIFGLVQLWPHFGSWREAGLFVAFFPPFYFIAEAANSWLLSPAHGKAISPKQFSWLRVFVVLPIAAAWLGLSWLFIAVILKS